MNSCLGSNDFRFRKYKALWKAYCDAMNSPDVHSHSEAIKKAISSPTSRYWISATEAYRQIMNIIAGKQPSYKKGGHKSKMIWQVYEEYLRLSQTRNFRDASVYFIASFAVLKPAPSFFISYDRARRIIHKIKKGLIDIYDEDED